MENKTLQLLLESRTVLVLCSLIDKSGQCTELVDKIDEHLNTLKDEHRN